MSGWNKSYWLDFPRPRFGALAGPVTVDVAIVGSGIAGLKLARCLSSHGLTVQVLESDQVGVGASSRNQGTINHGPNLAYSDCARLYGRETARRWWQLGLENHRLLCELIREGQIDCNHERLGMTILARTDLSEWEARLAIYRADYGLLRADGFDVEWLDERAATDAGQGPSGLYAGGLCYCSDGQFHSGRFAVGLAQFVQRLPGVSIAEGVRVLKVARVGGGVELLTSTWPVYAGCVFLATNALAPQFVPQLASSLRAERGQVLVTAPLPQRPCRGSFGTALAWWREIPLGDGSYRLLFGGGRTREEPDSLFPQFTPDGRPHPELEREGFSASVAHQARLDTQLIQLFPQWAGVEITHRWGGLQSFTRDDFPLVGCLDPERRIYGMVGLCGRGNCHSDVAAEYLAGRIAQVETPISRDYGDLFERFCEPARKTATWGPWYSDHGIADPLGSGPSPVGQT
ncbi:MAG: NAD(P)/FAD-dependent oxidoreductase [Planctomycetaceae bacterium]